MQVLNLIRPEKSNITYNVTTFPDGEPHIVLGDINRKDSVTVVCRIANPNDLYILLQVADILSRHEVIFTLQIYYLMSMRMDRVISFNESFSLKVVANLINSMGAESVHVLEPHSGKVQDLIDKYWGDMFMQMPNFTGYIPVFPDAGAVERHEYMGEHKLICSKTRNPETGKLEGFSIENPELLENEELIDMPLVVIDDLCDTGGTFVGVASKIREINPNRRLAIFVTHMVNPKGITALSENYDEVYFTNSYLNWENLELPSNVSVIKVV